MMTLLLVLIGCWFNTSDTPPTADKPATKAVKAAAAEPSESGTERPSNLIFISLDTVSADHLSMHGGQAKTPNIERIASSGVRFTNAYSHFPETAVSHWTMMTGALPEVHGDVPANGTSRHTGPTLAERMTDAGYQTAAFIGGETLTDRSTGLSRGFTLYDDQYPWNRADLKRPGKEVTKAAIQWINEQKKSEKPYFAFVHFFDAHFPYTPSAPWDTAYNPGYTGTITGSDADLMPYRDGTKTPSPEDVAHISALYDGEISELDAIIAPLLETANDGNTLIVITADHGESFGHDYWFNHRDALWDEVINVPLIMNGPNVPGKKLVGALTGLVDVTPTILDVLGMDPLENVHGATLRPVWTKPVYMPPIFSMTDPNRPSPQMSMRTLGHKLIVKVKDGKVQKDGALRYFMPPDPGENDPTVTLPEDYPDLEQTYRERLAPVIKQWQGPVPEPRTPEHTVTREEQERLKALGYVDGPAVVPTSQ
jgi:arylsulfatase A-like enzyme